MRHLAPIVLVVVVTGLACGSDSPTAPSSINAGISDSVLAAMQEAITDEYRAETTYQGIVADFGALAPFTNVLTAEQRHSTSIAGLFTSRGLAAPANPFTVAPVPHFATIPSACAAGVAAEGSNIAMYDRFLALNLPFDIRQVFENNRAASLFNHLPAFERCAG